VSAAERFVGSLFQVVERLAAFPESGRVVPEFGDPSIREVIRRPCRIVYRVDRTKQVIEIARVWHAARGIPEVQ
jgi:toxin ParE1/3/4